jgi:hypothetical protein
LAKGLRGSVFGTFADREVEDAERLFLRNKKNEERSKQPIENLSEASSQKIRKILFGMCSLEQTPRFTTNEHTIPMNSQWQHVLRRPSLQDLRRLKYTKHLFREV